MGGGTLFTIGRGVVLLQVSDLVLLQGGDIVLLQVGGFVSLRGGELVLLQGASLFTRGGQAKVCPFLRTLHYLCGLCAYNFLSRELSLVERVIALNENGRSLGGFQMKLKINVPLTF